MVPMHLFDQALAAHQTRVARINREAWKRPAVVSRTPSLVQTCRPEITVLVAVADVLRRWARRPHQALHELGAR